MSREILEMLFEQGALNFKKRIETNDPEIVRVSNDIILALTKTIQNVAELNKINYENIIKELFMRIYYNEITVADAIASIYSDGNFPWPTQS